MDLKRASEVLAMLSADSITLRTTRDGRLTPRGNVQPRHWQLLRTHGPALTALIELRAASATAAAQIEAAA